MNDKKRACKVAREEAVNAGIPVEAVIICHTAQDAHWTQNNWTRIEPWIQKRFIDAGKRKLSGIKNRSIVFVVG